MNTIIEKMRNKMNCTIKQILCLLLIIIVIGGGVWFMYKDTMPDIKQDKVVSDLHTKWTVLAPTGQLWGFAPDQSIKATVLEVKPSTAKDRVIVVTDLDVLAKIPVPPDTPKEQSAVTPGQTPNKSPAPEKAPVAVGLNGIAKLHYEKLADKWYLMEVEGVTLMVNPR